MSVGRDFGIFKNKIYYSLIYARDYMSEDDIMDENLQFIDRFRESVKWAIDKKFVPKDELSRFEQQVSEAMKVGLERGHSKASRKFISYETLKKHRGNFLPFPTVTVENGKEIVLIDKEYNQLSGISTYYRTLSKELSKLGHIVHVVCQHNESYNQVDLEHGVWIHRMAPMKHSLSDAAKRRSIPENIWSWSYTALEECKRIDSHRHVDVVEATLWDAEGCAFLLDGQWPLITFLVTPLAVWLESNQHVANNKKWMKNFGYPMLALEKELLQCSTALNADSQAIVSTIENAYDITINREKLRIIYLGIPEVTVTNSFSDNDNNILNILFVGRLEKRKGIDVLLGIIPEILFDYPNAQFQIAGDDSIKVNGTTYKAEFQSKYKNKQDILSRVNFLGRVRNERLSELYETCDIFVAPSRFESSGLMFLEAMRVRKPIIGCEVGGMLEIIEPGVTGLLAKPADEQSLSRTLRKLLDNPEIRRSIGQAGYTRFLEKFTSKDMAINFVSLCNDLLSTRNDK